jgi:hypothetical protein
VWIAREIPRGGAGRWRIETAAAANPPGPGVEVKQVDGGAIQVLAGGKEIARLVSEGQKPYLFPLLGPSGLLMTRRFPMEKGVAGEDQDHPHQRSLWFTHGSVQGVDFWSEGARAGSVRQVEVVAAEGGPVRGRIVTWNKWLAPAGARLSDGRTAPPEGEKLLDDRRTLTFYPLERGALLIDVTISLRSAGGPVVFGDTKEGTFGIRLAEPLKETRGGTIVNARGGRGMDQAWGQPAEWIDYFGPLGGETVGVAILDHPASFRHPTTWHVRNYGLFAANPFGYRDFSKGKAEKDGSFTLEPGKTMEFRYRVYLHHGDTEAAKVGAVYQGFASPPGVKISQGF